MSCVLCLVKIIGSCLLFLLLLIPHSDTMKLPGKKEVTTSLNIGTKFFALWERQQYYQTWFNVLAPGPKNDKAKIMRVFRRMATFPNVATLKKAVIKDEGGNEFPLFREGYPKNIEHHEYNVLEKQYGTVSERTRSFCNMLTIVGYQASPIGGPEEGKVIIRIKGREDKWLFCDLNAPERGVYPAEKAGLDKLNRYKECLQEIDNGFKKFSKRRYLWADKNILGYRILFEVQKQLGCELVEVDSLDKKCGI